MNKDDLEMVRAMLAGIRNALQRSYVLELLKSDKLKALTKELNYNELDEMITDVAHELFKDN